MKSLYSLSSLRGLVILLIVTFVTFSRVFIAQYVTWDDPVLILDNPLLQLPFFEAVPIFFTSFYHGDYMPLTLISYWLEVTLFGFMPLPAHLLNLALHLGCGFALFEFLRSTRLKEGGILFVCAVFLLHPLQVESVMWLSERKGLLSSLLLLLALVSSQKFDRAQSVKMRWMYLLGYYFLFLGALLAKATGVFVPVFLIFTEIFLQTEIKIKPNLGGSKWATLWPLLGRSLQKHAMPGLFALLIILVRVSAYGGEVSGFTSFFFEPQRWIQLPLIISSILGFYLSSFFLPISQSIIYPEYRFDMSLLFRALSLSAFAVAVAGLWRKTRNRGILYFALFSFVLLLPVLQIIPRLNLVSDRYLYLPGIGLAGLVAIAMERLSRQTANRIIYLAVAVLAPLSFFRSEMWVDDVSLWKEAVVAAPWSGLAKNNYAMVLEKQGDIPGAVAEFEKALSLGKRDGSDNLAYNNLGVLYTKYPQLLDRNRAVSYFEKGIGEALRAEERFTLRLNLAGTYADLGQLSKARELLVELEKDLLKATRDKKYLELLGKAQELLKKIDDRIH